MPTEKKNINTVNESVSVSCQTDIDQLETEGLVKNVVRLKIENKWFFETKSTATEAAGMKRELFMDNVLNKDASVKFYKGLPTLYCLMEIFNILKPLAEKLKFWDSNKGNRVNFQKEPSVKKSGIKRHQGCLPFTKTIRHKHKAIKCEVTGERITIKYIHIS